MNERRRFMRTKFESRVRIEQGDQGAAIFRTADVSDGGIAVQAGDLDLGLGDLVRVQIQNVPMEAPVIVMKVVRKDKTGYGLEFAM